ncbi:hypothetical protein EGM97_03595 [Pseudomonas sp. AF32]|nr:hypothetical protein [Pseudomonas sp. AF32]
MCLDQSSGTTQYPVGAGLLAKAVCQATSTQPGTPLSRASPLPQWMGASPISESRHKVRRNWRLVYRRSPTVVGLRSHF